jgi:hypothetical protein
MNFLDVIEVLEYDEAIKKIDVRVSVITITPLLNETTELAMAPSL